MYVSRLLVRLANHRPTPPLIQKPPVHPQISLQARKHLSRMAVLDAGLSVQQPLQLRSRSKEELAFGWEKDMEVIPTSRRISPNNKNPMSLSAIGLEMSFLIWVDRAASDLLMHCLILKDLYFALQFIYHSHYLCLVDRIYDGLWS